jgi:calcineurin-like phosphoesterase family protein
MRLLHNLKNLFPLSVCVMLFFSCHDGQTDSIQVRFGICTDVHKDIMHDADDRIGSFIEEASGRDLDFIIQLGDFVRPYEYNLEFLSVWNSYPGESYHVIGNHEPDGGFSKEDVVEFLGMPGMYYSFNKNGFHFIVLDGNDQNPSPDRPPGYSRYIGEEQIEWLKNEISTTEKNIIIFSHQSLENENGIDNKRQIRNIFEEENRSAGFKKILACFSGHHHTDYAVNINGIYYIQVNSMSYNWVGGDYQVIRYSEETDQEYPWIKYTIPYKDPLYAFVEINNEAIIIEGRETTFVGPGPDELGMPPRPVNNPIVPRISDRELQLAK